MSAMLSRLGWRDILRPIRDGYRQLFPAPDTGPTPEERCRQRDLDRLKGFTYFDTIAQLEAWTQNASDPLQRANTPRLPRHQVEAPHDDGKAGVLLIHDYAGNYHDYESVNAIGVTEAFYTCEYLAFVNAFIYFSHKLVCVPPPTWTNALHRAGVTVLGTLLVEPQTKGSEQLLDHVTSAQGMTFPFVTILAAIAQHYGFDGYLVNIEKPFTSNVWNPQVLEAFLDQLRRELGTKKRLIWYDALTTENRVSYQNALNNSNIIFAKACGSILTNYCWKETDAESSKRFALRNDIPLKNIFFGVDVWAQNTTKLSHPRVTYPEKGGGGTNTGVAVAKLASLGLSAGIFAPAWSFEHFPGHARDVERAVWEGDELPSDIICACGDCPSRHRANAEYPNIKYSRESAVGSESFFHTDFSRAFGRHGEKEKNIFDAHDMHAQLGQQSNLPRSTRVSNGTIVLSNSLTDKASESALVVEVGAGSLLAEMSITPPDVWLYLPLYKLNMPLNAKLQLHATIPRLACPPTMDIEFFIKTKSSYEGISIVINKRDLSFDAILGGEVETPYDTIEELGIRARGTATSTDPFQILHVSSLSITPTSVHSAIQGCKMTSVQIIDRGDPETPDVRLSWTYESTAINTLAAQKVPFSDITGVFSYFTIKVDHMTLGRAYALEYKIASQVLAIVENKAVMVEIQGVGFDGRSLAGWSGMMRFSAFKKEEERLSVACASEESRED